MIKFGVIGSGWIAEEFVKGSLITDDFEFSAMYSRTYDKGEKFASQFSECDVKIYTDLNEFAKSEIDAVYIASPNFLHYEQSKLMLENGKHVLCEKPITVSPDEFNELRALANEKNLIYTEAIMMLHNPIEKKIKEELKSLGNISTAHFDFSQLSSKYQALLNGENPNIFNPDMKTGCLRDLGIYCFYPAVDFFGMPDEIISSAGFVKTGADGYGTAVLNYPDKQVTLTYSKTGQDCCGSQIIGDKGTMVFESISKFTGVYIKYNNGDIKQISDNIEKHILMAYEARNFCKFIAFRNEDTKEYEQINDIIYN
ncbi:MAG: Gfo/Idh/MocA family oxidoreductase, partial [Ruminococcus sp.]|nr:Gfo/Idh/MocA family oxidoreductase [Candidatus Copronaster equi]